MTIRHIICRVCGNPTGELWDTDGDEGIRLGQDVCSTCTDLPDAPLGGRRLVRPQVGGQFWQTITNTAHPPAPVPTITVLDEDEPHPLACECGSTEWRYSGDIVESDWIDVNDLGPDETVIYFSPEYDYTERSYVTCSSCGGNCPHEWST